METPAVFTATAGIVRVPSVTHNNAGGTIAALNVSGSTAMAAVSIPIATASSKLKTNVLRSRVPANDTFMVEAKKVKLAANVTVKGRLDVINTETMLVRDTTIALGAIDADGDNLVDPSDITRDGAGLVIPGTPANLPITKNATAYEHSVKWRVHDGDFTGGGIAVDPHLKPMWNFTGGGVAIACPDARDRIAKFVFAPSFTSTSASLGLYYDVGENAYLVQNFATTPFNV